MANIGALGGPSSSSSSYIGNNPGFNEFSLQAKVIVLGDAKVGKSSLIHNLDPQTRGGYRGADGFGADDIIFSVVEFPIGELIASSSSSSHPLVNSKGKTATRGTTGPSVFLKIWEYNPNISKEEEELAFRGALFCVIVLDLRSPESAKSVFAKWISIKEKNMNESFLFVVGTHLDRCTQRRVDIAEVCKACAQKEAIYTEISNYDGTNIPLLRKLMAQRINYVLSVRESMNKNMAAELESEKKGELPIGYTRSGSMDGDIEEFSEEAKLIQDHERVIQNTDGPLNAPFLEQDLLCDSVGSILASALGTEFWPGYDVEEEHLTQIAKALSGFVDKLTTDSKSLPKSPLEGSILDQETLWSLGGGIEGSALRDIPEPDYDSLKHVFEVMGFAVPQSLLSSTSEIFNAPIDSGVESKLNNPASSPSRSSIVPDSATNKDPLNTRSPSQKQSQYSKLKVRLPDGSMSVLVIYPEYEVADQVDAFLIQYGMDEDKVSRDKLIEVAIKLRSQSNPAPSTTASHAELSDITSPTGKSKASTQTVSQAQPVARKSIINEGSNITNASGSGNNSSADSDLATQRRNSSMPIATDTTMDSTTAPVTPVKSSAVLTSTTVTPTAAPMSSAAKATVRTPLMVPAPVQKVSNMTNSARKEIGTPQQILSASASSQPKPQSRKCKIRIQLPDFAGGAIETVVREGQDLMEVAKSIAVEHNLSWGYQQKVYDQLRAAFKR